MHPQLLPVKFPHLEDPILGKQGICMIAATNADFNKMILCALQAKLLEIDCARQTMSVLDG
jgi:hypothetical protein